MILDHRMKWGFDNPNDAAAFWVLMLLALPSALLLRRSGSTTFALSVIGMVAILFLILLTASRGAILALFVAGAIHGGHALRSRIQTGQRRIPKRTLSLALLSLVVLGLVTFATPLGSRFSDGFSGSDPSVSIRAVILRDVPGMMVSAPGGWGAGQAAHAWQNWFEQVGGRENLSHLLSSHATWLVEWPWLARIAYVFGWALLFAFALPLGSCLSADALAFFVAAFVLAFCNHVFLNPLVFAVFILGGIALLVRQWVCFQNRPASFRRLPSSLRPFVG